MKDNERPNLKQIRIKRSVCDRLDNHKGKDDSYTDVVKALLDENERLTSRCEELQADKQVFMRLNELRKRTVKHNAILESEDIEVLLNEGVNVFYRQHYTGNYRHEYVATPLELVGVISILNALYELDIEYGKTYDIDRTRLHKLMQDFDALRLTNYKGEDYDDFDMEDSLYEILKCNYRDYDVKDDLAEYLQKK